MLARADRLTRSDEFRRAVRQGRRAASRTLVLHLADDADPLRAGFIVGRQVGQAVRRNRVRRQLRHLIRERLSGLPASGLLVVRALPGAATASGADLRSDLDVCLSRLQRGAA